MAKRQQVPKTIPHYSGWRPRSMRKGGPPKSQTPGSAKNEYCKKTTIGGVPRSAYIRSRGYKLKTYHIWCAFVDRAN